MSVTSEVLRPELTPLPDRLATRPIYRGYPVPWFVAYPNGPDGDPDLRVADRDKWKRAVQDKLCWVCGEPLGAWLVFVLGPMCGITRTTSEPACHRECAEWSVRNCPFLTRPHAVYRTADLPEGFQPPPGCPLDRNPGVALLWRTKTFRLFRAPDNRLLIQVGEPVEVACYAEGRRATRQEVDESIAGGLPSLIDLAKQEGAEAEWDLSKQVAAFEWWLPGR